MFAVSIYRRLIGVQVRSQMQYRFAFAVEFVSTFFINFTYFVALALIIQRFRNIAGWRLGEIAFLYGFVETAFGTMDFLFGGYDYDNFGNQIRLGRFDQLLLRPVPLPAQILGSEFQMRRLSTIFQGVVVFAYGLATTAIQWSLLKLFYLPVAFASLVCFFGGLYVVGSTVTFWTIQGLEAMNVLTYGGREMMEYPMSIYPGALRRVFTTLIPAVFVSYAPALYLLGKPDPLHLPAFAPVLSPVVGFGALWAAFRFWNYGVRHYQSAGT